MKKFLFLLILVFSFVTTETVAQIYRLDRALNSFRQRNQQRTIPRNNSQQTYQNRQHANQQRKDEQQREYMQQKQQSKVSDEESRTVTTVHTDANNTTQGNDKVVSLVVNGTGSTKEEATKNALRSAIEQAFGTFISANTEVLNDELRKDETVTVSTGSVKSFRELSSTRANGLYDVSVQATVSIDQLTKFAQSKGMQVELAGASFMMNMKMRELNKKNEVYAIEHMIEKAKAIAHNGLFDYKIEIGDPQLTSNSNYAVKIKVLFCENENTKSFYNTIYNTFEALSLSKTEIAEYNRTNLDYYVYDKQLIRGGSGVYVLRNDLKGVHSGNGSWRYPWIMPTFMELALDYEIRDNIGNVWICETGKVEDLYSKYGIDNQYQKMWYCKERIGSSSWDSEYFCILSPPDRIAGITGKTRNEGGITLNIPLVDYGFNSSSSLYLHFNPLVHDDRNTYDRYDCERRINSRIYFQQEFFIIYSQDELSRLNSITINHRRY